LTLPTTREHQRDRDLADDERSRQPRPSSSRGEASRGRLERVAICSPRGPDGRHDAEQKRRDKGEQPAHQPVRQQQTHRASPRGQYECFGEQLTHDIPANLTNFAEVLSAWRDARGAA
jgi:hypothetical protein